MSVSATKPKHSSRVMELSSGKSVSFIDNSVIAEVSGVERRFGQPVVIDQNPIFRPQRPWEGRCVIVWGSVIWDPADMLFKMWYVALHPDKPKNQGMTLLCYAHSVDGVNWERPSLGLCQWNGSVENNILMGVDIQLDTPTVYLDPYAESDDERFKMMIHHRDREGFHLYASADGIAWRSLWRVPLKASVGDRHTLMLDRESKAWRIYHKIEGQPRTVWLATSNNLRDWTEQGEVLVPDQNDPPETEFYGLYGFTYEGHRLGYLEVFDVLQRRLHTELVTLDESGRPIRFEPRHRFLNAGQWGQWDYAWAFPSQNEPIRVGEELWIYFHGRQTLHWAMPPWGNGHIGAIGLAKLRPSGFAFLQSQDHGQFTTHPFEISGCQICINADARGGVVRCELLDESGGVIPGYTADQFHPLADNVTYFKCNWSGQSNLQDLRGKTVRLRVQLDRAKFYSFWVASNTRG